MSEELGIKNDYIKALKKENKELKDKLEAVKDSIIDCFTPQCKYNSWGSCNCKIESLEIQTGECQNYIDKDDEE